MSPQELESLEGQAVTAKRLGWDDGDDPVAGLDVEPYVEKGYASPDLSGPLSVVPFDGGVACLVGGQEADPKTVKAAAALPRQMLLS
jgi:hypothetical protein